MGEFDEIQASLASFAKHIDEAADERSMELRKCSFFNPIPGEQLSAIAQHATLRTFEAGDRLTSEGQALNTFHVIMYGSATVYVNHRIVGRLPSGDCVGESIFFGDDNLPCSATVIADGELVAAEFAKSGLVHLEDTAKSYLDKALLIALYRKLQSANLRIVSLL